MGEKKDRSNWLKALVGLRCLDGIAALMSFNLIAFFITMFIGYRLWQRNKFWRNVIAYLLVPFSFIVGLYSINQYDYVGEAIIIEVIIYIILLAKSWNEFEGDQSEEDKKLDEELEASKKTRIAS